MDCRAIALVCWCTASIGLISGEAWAEPTARFASASSANDPPAESRSGPGAPAGSESSEAAGTRNVTTPALVSSGTRAPHQSAGLDQNCGGAAVLVARARGLARRDVLQALTMYSRAVSLNPTCGAATLELAELRARLGDIPEAERLLARAVRQRDLAPRALKTRATLRRSVGRNVDATIDMQAAVTLRPNDLEAIRTLAGWYVEDRAWVAALTQYRALVRVLDERHLTAELDEARLHVHALMLMAAETDPVAHGATSDSWVRRSLSTLARR